MIIDSRVFFVHKQLAIGKEFEEHPNIHKRRVLRLEIGA